MKIFFSLVLLIFSLAAGAEDSAQKTPAIEINPSRPRASDELNKESSSFVPDPDSLDPLPVKKENLKEDDEPVLDDIRQVIDAPSKKKKAATKTSNSGTKNRQKKSQSGAFSSKNKKVAKASKKNRSQKDFRISGENLQDDNPDLVLENSFYNLYKTYNAEPTAVEDWNKALEGKPTESYKVQKGDTLWSISKTLFGDPNFWPKLWSVNKNGILNPHSILPGSSILFYPGSATETPRLGVSDADATADESKHLTMTELGKTVRAGAIPDSIPLSRNDRYFLPPAPLKIELRPQSELNDDYTNDIILTDKPVETEVEITLSEMVKGRCGGEHMLKANSLKATEGTLKIFETLESFDSDAGEIYPYRLVGEAKVISDQKIKITTCKSVMSSKLVFVSPSQVANWRTSKSSTQAVPSIVGGPNIGTQLLFADHQAAYINMGSQSVEIGQTLQIKSQLTESPSGEVRVIDKFGSFAIGIITDVQDLIEKGDEVLIK